MRSVTAAKFMPSSKLGFKDFRVTVAAIGSPDVCKEGLWYQQETSKLKNVLVSRSFKGLIYFWIGFA